MQDTRRKPEVLRLPEWSTDRYKEETIQEITRAKIEITSSSISSRITNATVVHLQMERAYGKSERAMVSKLGE
jgi:hypothetical protein